MTFYNGYSNVMDPKYKLHSYRLGTQTNPTVPSQLQEFGKKINEGVKNIEIGALQVETFESIPKQHLKSISEWAKLADVNVSLHAPVVGFDAGGFEQGRIWLEQKRKKNEQFLKSVLERAYLLSKGKDQKTEKYDSVPVVIHATAPETKGIIYEKGLKKIKRDKNGNEIYKNGTPVLEPYEDDLGIRSMRIVNQKTGEVQEVKHETKYSMQTGKEEIWDIQRKLESANHTEWDKEKRELAQMNEEIVKREERTDELRRRNALLRSQIQNWQQQDSENFRNQIESASREIENNQIRIQNSRSETSTFETHLRSQFSEIFDLFQRTGTNHDKNIFRDLRKEKEKLAERMIPEEQRREVVPILNKIDSGKPITEPEGRKLQDFFETRDDFRRAERILTLNTILKTRENEGLNDPKIFSPINEFAKDKLAETLSNTMVHTYKKFKDAAPTLAVENFWTDSALTRAGDLKDAILKSREETVKKLVKEGVKEKEAKRWVDQHLGVTWDIGHISSLRNAGLSDEELKKIVKKETKKISEGGLVKHAHMWDNFGFHSAHLPAGTADIPIEEVLEELEKTDYRGRIIDEGGSWANSFKESSFPVVLQNFKVPIYGVHGGPGWNPAQYSIHSDSFIEFPQTHFNLYGSSFTTLPKEFGGQIGGEKSRFSGTPNQ